MELLAVQFGTVFCGVVVVVIGVDVCGFIQCGALNDGITAC